MKNIIAIVFIIVGQFSICLADDIEISKVNGHSGRVYFTIRVNNAPTQVSSMKFMIPLPGDMYAGTGDDIIVGPLRDNIKTGSYGYRSGASDNGIFVNIVLKEPLPAGTNGPLFKIPLSIQNIYDSCQLTMINIEGDIVGWNIKNGEFSYITDDNQNPVINAGKDSYIINSIMFDGSKCFDYDGMIVSWDWYLTHRTNSRFNKHLSGRNAIADNLPGGIYDVELTIKDNTGLTSTDLMVLSVSGTSQTRGDITGDGVIGIDDIIYSLQVISGARN